MNNDADEQIFAHRHTLRNLAAWDLHTISRTTFAMFGSSDEVLALDADTIDAGKMAFDLFGSYSASELRFVDTPVVHLPYLIVPTAIGGRRVESEAERRAAKALGGKPVNIANAWEREPSWAASLQPLFCLLVCLFGCGEVEAWQGVYY